MVKSLEQLNQEFIKELTSGQAKTPTGTANEFEQWFAELIEDQPAQVPLPAQQPVLPQLGTQILPQAQQPQPVPAPAIHSWRPPAPENPAETIETTEAVGLQPVYTEMNAEPEIFIHPEAGTRKKRKGKLASDIVFYAVIAIILITTLLYSGKANNDFNLFGYSGFVVLGSSMEKEIPQGALVITRKVKPEDIRLGDDITFFRIDNSTVTHRVVDIIENYEDSGNRVFQTQGIANPDPDPEPVYEGNIIGIVKHSIPELGFFLNSVSDNIILILVILGVLLIVAFAFSRVSLAKKEEKPKIAAAA